MSFSSAPQRRTWCTYPCAPAPRPPRQNNRESETLLSARPRSTRRAVCLDLADKADVLEYYSEDVTVRSVREEFYLPAVLRVRTHRSKAQHSVVSLSRTNILLRDRYQCQYCGSGRELTIGGWLGGGWPGSIGQGRWACGQFSLGLEQVGRSAEWDRLQASVPAA